MGPSHSRSPGGYNATVSRGGGGGGGGGVALNSNGSVLK